MKKAPKIFWIIFAVSLGITIAPIGWGIGAILIWSSGFSYNSGETTLTIESARKIKKATNDSEYAKKRLEEKIERLETTLNFLIENDATPNPILKTIKSSVDELQPTVQELEKSNAELKEVVNEVREDTENVSKLKRKNQN